MKVIVTTDTHFGHEKMVELSGRPKDFEQKIFKNLLSLLSWDTVLIHLGDVGLGREKAEIFNRFIVPLPAKKKILIRGNHDRESNTWYMEHGFDWVCEEMLDRYFGRRILFSHLPIAYNGQYEINIHGHLHNDVHRSYEPALMANKNPRQHLLSLEQSEYKSWNLQDLVQSINP